MDVDVQVRPENRAAWLDIQGDGRVERHVIHGIEQRHRANPQLHVDPIVRGLDPAPVDRRRERQAPEVAVVAVGEGAPAGAVGGRQVRKLERMVAVVSILRAHQLAQGSFDRAAEQPDQLVVAAIEHQRRPGPPRRGVEGPSVVQRRRRA